MRPLRTIIIEDDPTTRTVLRGYLQRTPWLSIVGEYADPLEAGMAFSRNTIDLILLDIKLPVLNGFSFLESLEQPPMVVVLSADAHYAAKAFDHAVIDFLHKPVSFERFTKAMERVRSSPAALQLKQETGSHSSAAELDRAVQLRSGGSQVHVRLGDIELVQSLGNYVKLHLRSDVKLVVHETMSHMEELLPAALFVRIHRSHIISIDAVHAVRSKSVEWRKGELPLGETYKQHALQALTWSR
jgi:two-component system, LytTR family, response regulator